MPEPDHNRIDVEDAGESTIVKFVDHKILNNPSMEALAERLFALANKLGGRRLVLDFCNVQYLQSSVLGVLITLNRKVSAGGGRLVFRNIDAEVRKVFAMTRLDQLFTIEEV